MKVAILSKQHPWLCSDTIAVVGNASFPDFDLDAYDIGGELIWDAPKPDLSFVTHYMVYMARIPTRSQETRRFEASNEHGCESALAIALQTNNTAAVTNIDLDGRDIGDSGTKALGEMLAANTLVKSLNLHSTGISDEGVQVLAKGLHTNHSLEVLELHGNNFTSLAGQVLIEALEANSTLKKLVVDHEVAEVLRPVERSKRLRRENFEVIDWKQLIQDDETAAEKCRGSVAVQGH